jgi:hypothetical protein
VAWHILHVDCWSTLKTLYQSGMTHLTCGLLVYIKNIVSEWHDTSTCGLLVYCKTSSAFHQNLYCGCHDMAKKLLMIWQGQITHSYFSLVCNEFYEKHCDLHFNSLSLPSRYVDFYQISFQKPVKIYWLFKKIRNEPIVKFKIQMNHW